ncbi:MAG: hypothetical protein IT522_12750 [Burkholderiales bacterium]|nr:hypothetical protein [Burkholderiales bacterium]
MPPTHHPHAFVHHAVLAGVRIRSDRPLIDLPVDGEWDLEVDVRFSAGGDRPADAGAGPPADDVLPEGACALPASTRQRGWIAAHGREVVIIEPPMGIADRALAVRSVLPFASTLQGGGVLHASAVAFPDGVHAFVGASGAGKSTLAANLGALGWPTVADDLTPCRLDGARVHVPLPATLAGRTTDATLRAIHFLARSPRTVRVQRDALSPAACIAQLLRNGFSDVESRELWAQQFAMCTELARRVPAFDLVVPDARERVPAIAADVRDSLAAPSSIPAAG